MESIKVKEQYIFTLNKNGKKIFYNNVNGKIGIAKVIEDLDKEFLEPATDIQIELDDINYEQLYLVVTESCNFHCKYCRQKKSEKVINMKINEIKDAIDIFFSVAKEPKSIVFFGGEPLLNIEGIKFAVEYARSFDPKVKFSTVINGSLCTEAIAKFFKENQVEVIVSLDGPEEFHNIARINNEQKGTYKQAVRGYNYLKEVGNNPGISVVIGPHNEKYFDKLIDWAIELKPNTLGFCLPHGDMNNFAMKLTSFNSVHKSMIEAFEILHENGIYLVQVEQKMEAFILGNSIPYECKACGRRLVVCKDKRYGICEGPITNHKMFHKDLNKLPQCIYEYRKSSPFFNENCRKCIAYRICGGGCVYDKITRFGRADCQDNCRCGLNRLIAEKSLEYISDNLSLFSDSCILTYEWRRDLYKKLSI